jgi:hypothetical protein
VVRIFGYQVFVMVGHGRKNENVKVETPNQFNNDTVDSLVASVRL